ncbi:hypothetical protein LTR70_002900 [Exophiala xenobiotica]|uniref:Uncharacterized protein n=1 Tax=Lithohypha guttulata TaxID=1690604 RepID=A0ABR0KHN5_9EURO|nr:hypothetical protein LTR24_002493 [Lithohypha guttulata]KAK5324453.1 hypothetical protein LTR70_002900 [Exophiala xenobiotica]
MSMMQQQSTSILASSAGAADPAPKAATNVQAATPLDSDIRVQPLHPSVPEVKLPRKVENELTSADAADRKQEEQKGLGSPSATTLNPVTLQPFTLEELRSYNIDGLLRQYSTPDSARKAQDETAKELRKLLDENEVKTKEIDREMEEKEKTREIERKVYARKLGKDG